jgi:hypothetical protein
VRIAHSAIRRWGRAINDGAIQSPGYGTQIFGNSPLDRLEWAKPGN